MLKKYQFTFKTLFIFLDITLLFICWVLAYVLRFKVSSMLIIHTQPTFHEHVRLFFYILAIYIVVFNWLGLYRPMRERQFSGQFLSVFWALVTSVILFTSFIYFFRDGYRYSRVILAIFLILSAVVLVIYRVIVFGILRWMRQKGYNLRHILIIGTGDLARSVAQKISRHLEFGFNIVGFLARRKNETGKEIINGLKVIGTYGDLAAISKQHGIDQVIFCLDSMEERSIRPLLNRIDNEGVDLKIILDLGNIFTLRNRIDEFEGLTVLTLRESPLFGWPSFVKRTADIVISFWGLCFLFPFFCLCASLIKLTSPGPVLYSQQRVGIDGRVFRLFKFRTMRQDAERESGAVFAKKDDRRITPVGKVLRRFSLDELPQLFNVLKGDMSLVGPRPERPEFIDEFHKNIPRYILRHKIKTGMTGWAQVNGLRQNSSIRTRLEYDLHYIEHWSIWFDLKILFLTVFAVLKGEGAY